MEVPSLKALVLGESGEGKTTLLASAVCAKYKVRLEDVDGGYPLLLSMLTDADNYPHARYCRDHGINPDDYLDVIPIDLGVKFGMREVPVPGGKPGQIKFEEAWYPNDSSAWSKASNIVVEWKDGTGTNLGKVETWGTDTILCIDSWSKLSRGAFYRTQIINNRAAGQESGNMWRQDVGGAQTVLGQMLEWLYSPRVKCHVLVMTHISSSDDSRGFLQAPGQIAFSNPNALVNAKGYPMAIGRAMSKTMGTFFNDQYIVQDHRLWTTRRTVAGASVNAKTSFALRDQYDTYTALAEILPLRERKKPDQALISALKSTTQTASLGDPTQVQAPSANDPIAALNARMALSAASKEASSKEAKM